MRSRTIMLATILVVLAGSTWAPAQEKSGQDKSAEVEIWAIRATTRNNDISPELRELAETLKKQFKYTGFKLERRERGKVDLGKAFKMDLPGGYKAAVTPLERESDKKIKLRVEVTRREGKEDRSVLNTTMTMDAGKFVPFGCGTLDGGDYLLIAVRAR